MPGHGNCRRTNGKTPRQARHVKRRRLLDCTAGRHAVALMPSSPVVSALTGREHHGSDAVVSPARRILDSPGAVSGSVLPRAHWWRRSPPTGLTVPSFGPLLAFRGRSRPEGSGVRLVARERRRLWCRHRRHRGRRAQLPHGTTPERRWAQISIRLAPDESDHNQRRWAVGPRRIPTARPPPTPAHPKPDVTLGAYR